MGFFDGLKNIVNFVTMFPDPDDIFNTRQKYENYVQKRRDYRLGKQDKQLKVKFGQPDDNVRCNLIGKAINQSVYLLVGQGVDFDLPGDDETPQDLWLDACWKANNKQVLLHRAVQNASEAGNGYIKIIPDGVAGMLNNKEVLFPRLVCLDPKWMSMDTNPEDFEQVIRYTIRFTTTGPDGKERARKQVIEFIDDGYWLISDYYNDHSTAGKWVLMSELRWDYNFAPIVNWQNLPSPNSVYGEPDIDDDVIELQDRYNFVASNINKIIRYHAHPKTYGINTGKPDKESWGADQMVLFNNGGENAQLDNLEMQSDLESSINFFNLLGKSILDNTSTVDVNNLKDKLGQLTNFAVRVLFNDALSKMNVKRQLFEIALKDLNHRLLVIAGLPDDPGEVVWPESVLPINEKEVLEVQKTELELGLVSKQTVSMERGRDFKQEQERIGKESANESNVGDQILRTFERGQ